jgi:hypothetical protein
MAGRVSVAAAHGDRGTHRPRARCPLSGCGCTPSGFGWTVDPRRQGTPTATTRKASTLTFAGVRCLPAARNHSSPRPALQAREVVTPPGSRTGPAAAEEVSGG